MPCFALPSEYDALDTCLVRVFGIGDPTVKKVEFLKLTITYQKTGYSINANQSYWPSEYNTCILILRYIGEKLNSKGVECPHPTRFEKQGLRNSGIWVCAEVEMALFAYSSYRITDLGSIYS